ncbi:hypothetical protein HF680_06280 [Brevundimonas sp. WCHBH090558]|uniref:hypothetical protein n=1 Tax=Brevundimonas huaxiensis TaxID=2725493 RepID=UPI00162635AC|nr:hypothetical protein [Brevundimonas huaxiensis]MBC1182263.1 hypothetical protein [Brevundimonas huaxiensis]
MKQQLYQQLMKRMDQAVQDGRDVEAGWYAYAVLEDRLRSMLRQSGGEGQNKGIGKPIRMMGPKLTELSKRAKKDELLKSSFEYTRLNKWKNDRNGLVHAMADGQHDIEEIDRRVADLATEGVLLARLYASEARRLKTHRAKVTQPAL